MKLEKCYREFSKWIKVLCGQTVLKKWYKLKLMFWIRWFFKCMSLSKFLITKVLKGKQEMLVFSISFKIEEGGFLKLFNLKSMVLSIFLSFNCICSHSRQFRSFYWKIFPHFWVVLEITELYFILIVVAWSTARILRLLPAKILKNKDNPSFFHSNYNGKIYTKQERIISLARNFLYKPSPSASF